MPFRNPQSALTDILECLSLIQRSTADQTLYSLSANPEKLADVKHWLLILAEAAYRLGPDAPEICPGPDWRNIRGFGNVIRHENDNIHLEQLWRVIVAELPPLRTSVEEALTRLPAGTDA